MLPVQNHNRSTTAADVGLKDGFVHSPSTAFFFVFEHDLTERLPVRGTTVTVGGDVLEVFSVSGGKPARNWAYVEFFLSTLRFHCPPPPRPIFPHRHQDLTGYPPFPKKPGPRPPTLLLLPGVTSCHRRPHSHSPR